jgi:anti-anti-sigma factor
MTAPSFEIRVDDSGVIWLSGELDLAQADAFIACAVACVDSDRDVVVDCSQLTFLDSSGIRAIFQLASRAERGVVLRDPSDNVRRVLSVAGVDGQMGVRVGSPR